MSQRSSRTLALLVASAVLPLAAFAAHAEDKVLATVNGHPITQQTLDFYAQQRAAQAPEDKTPHDKNAMLQELVNRELLYEDARKKKLEKEPEVKKQLALQRREILIAAALRNQLSKTKISEDELRKEYKERVADANVHEYKARHILTASEDDAKKVVKELENGADFAKLAKEKSIGPSGEQGGELGWFNPSQMVPQFSQAVENLKKGEYTKEPVKTQFGWHVIKLEDSRKVTPPPFDKIEPRLRQVLQSQKLREYVGQLRKEAKVDIK